MTRLVIARTAWFVTALMRATVLAGVVLLVALAAGSRRGADRRDRSDAVLVAHQRRRRARRRAVHGRADLRGRSRPTTATVVVDQSRLEPSVVQFAPFEVLGGTHGADLRTDQRRFFQYQYRLRLIAEDMFGKDVALPEHQDQLPRAEQGRRRRRRCRAAIRPTCCRPQSVRVLSLVPADASDIRDTPARDLRRHRSARRSARNLLTVIGGVLFALAGARWRCWRSSGCSRALPEAGQRQPSG